MSILALLPLLACVFVAGLLAPLAAPAQVVRDGTLGPAGGGLVPGGVDDLGQAATYLIEEGLGERAGSSLFHSFGQFDVGPLETATFTAIAPTDQVLARVTGGDASQVHGTLRSTIPGADLFLMNPAGVVFGEGSSLDVPAGFHVTTGQYLRHADGTRFEAQATAPPILSVAPVEAFGFLDAPIGQITLEDTRLELDSGQRLSLIGGDIDISGHPPGAVPDIRSPVSIEAIDTSTLRVPDGRVQLVSVASPGEVASEAPELDAFESLGRIRLLDTASIDVSGETGGTLVVRAQDFELRAQTGPDPSGSTIAASGLGAADHPGVAVDIDVRGTLRMQDGRILSVGLGEGRMGTVRIRAHDVVLRGGTLSSFTGVISLAVEGARAGDIDLEADRLELSFPGAQTAAQANPRILSVTLAGTNRAGDVHIRVRALELADGSAISTQAMNGAAEGGDLVIEAQSIRLARVSSLRSIAGTFGGAPGPFGPNFDTGTGKGGDLIIRADRIELSQGGLILSSTQSLGDAGNLVLEVGELELDGGSNIASGTTNGGNGGEARIRAERIELRQGSNISSNTRGAGDAGLVSIDAAELRLSGQSNVLAAAGAFSTGDAGAVRVRAGKLELANGIIGSNALGTGDAGRVEVVAERIELTEGGKISTAALQLGPRPTIGGRAGELVVRAGSISMSGSALDSSGLLLASGISSQTWDGDGGQIRIESDQLAVLDEGEITAASYSPFGGRAGSISIEASDVRVTGRIEAGSLGPPNRLFSIGTGAGGDVMVGSAAPGSRLLVDGGLIASRTQTTGDGGNVSVAFDHVALAGGGAISAESTSLFVPPGAAPGLAGNVTVVARDTLHAEGGAVTAASAQGDGGNITILAGTGLELFGSSITAEVGGGADTTGGNITIDPDWVILEDGSRIVANAFEGQGGNIDITTRGLFVSPDSVISASSQLGVSGQVNVDAPEANVSAELASLPQEYQDAANLLRQQCGLVEEGRGRFAVVGLVGLPPTADDPLSSSFVDLIGGDIAGGTAPAVAREGCSN